jgi:hypothetical protein
MDHFAHAGRSSPWSPAPATPRLQEDFLMKPMLVAALILGAPALALGAPALALAAPPPEARPLSEILQAIEAQGDVRYFDEIEWDDDGYWEIEYYDMDGRKVEIHVDPVSGERR